MPSGRPKNELNDRYQERPVASWTINDTFVMAWQGLDQNNIWVSVFEGRPHLVAPEGAE